VPDRLTSEAFAGRIGEAFEVLSAEGSPLALVLSECEADRYERSFSLLFHARDGRLEPQQTFRARHPELGEFDLFLVPLGPDEGGMRYEAIFTEAPASSNR
jgi:hypothetical protein